MSIATTAPPRPPVPELSPATRDLHDFHREQEEAGLRESLETFKKTAARVRTKSGKVRATKFLAAVIALRLNGHKPTASAEILGVSVERVKRALQQVRQEHTLEHLLQRIDDVVLPLAVDNAAEGILHGDKDYTLEILRGRGLLRTHKSIEASVKHTVLQMKVSLTMPDHLQGAAPPQPRAGSIVGAPSIQASLPAPDQLEGRIVTVQTAAGETVAVLKDPA